MPPCLPKALDLLRPNAETAKPASTARAAGNPFTSDRMLAQNVRAVQSRLSALPHLYVPVKGVWGFAPCLSPALDLPRPKAENANTSGSAPPSHKVMGYGVKPHVYHRP